VTGINRKLTSAEVSQLWSNYMNDSMSICMLKYFKETAEDIEIAPLIDFAWELSQTHIQNLKTIFQSQNHSIPPGFIDEDVNLTAPRLFTDNYFLYFLLLLAEDTANIMIDNGWNSLQALLIEMI
jgi:hypothetical protein